MYWTFAAPSLNAACRRRMRHAPDCLLERVEFELTGDLRSGLLAINNRRADDHCPRIPLRAV